MSSTSSLVSYLNAGLRVLLVGPPGCAKSARVFAVAAQTDHKAVIFRASLAERVDLGGCLVPDISNGVTRALPLDLLHYLRTTKDRVLFVLDDLGQAPTDVQASCMSLFDQNALSPTVTIWGATNRPGDKAGVTALCEPLRSRFHLAFSIPTPDAKIEDGGQSVMLGTWADELEAWTTWAVSASAPAEVVAWHRSTKGRTLYAWKPAADPAARMPDFRSWETVSRLWNAGIRDISSVASAIGKPAAAEFLAFASLADQLPTPEQVFLDPTGAPVPSEPAAQYLIAAMLGRAAEPKFAAPLLTYAGRLPRVMGALVARDAFKRLGATLAGTPAWKSWWLKNKQLFEQG